MSESEQSEDAGEIDLEPRQNPLFAEKIKTMPPDQFKADHVRREPEDNHKRQLVRLFRKQKAAEFVGTLEPGANRFGLSKGQFSLVDIIEAVAEQIGPSHFSLSTWTVARADLQSLQNMLKKSFLSMRFLLDFSFQRRQPTLIAHIREKFGEESIVITRNHCKFCLFKSEQGRKIVVRTSMNLNFNPRLEDVEVRDDPAMYDFLDEILKEIFSKHDARKQSTKTTKELAGEFSRFDA